MLHKEIEFVDIDSEEWRIYEFQGKSGTIDKIKINSPISINVSESGGHRVLDAEGISHYIPKGWIHLYWRTKEGQPNFVY